jgi:protein-arginine kinase activator protein McsA
VLTIASAIRNKKDKAEFFSFGRNTENIAIAKPTDYETILSDAISHFTKAEEYEMAAHARDVLRMWKVEQLLSDDRSE